MALLLLLTLIFTLREPNVYKPHGFFLGFLATFICFCVTVLFYHYLYFEKHSKEMPYKKSLSVIGIQMFGLIIRRRETKQRAC